LFGPAFQALWGYLASCGSSIFITAWIKAFQGSSWFAVIIERRAKLICLKTCNSCSSVRTGIFTLECSWLLVGPIPEAPQVECCCTCLRSLLCYSQPLTSNVQLCLPKIWQTFPLACVSTIVMIGDGWDGTTNGKQTLYVLLLILSHTIFHKNIPYTQNWLFSLPILQRKHSIQHY
jgi:hypothetical protein